MSYVTNELTYPSTDGRSVISASVFVPEGKPRGVVYISHGMIDHIGRYSFVRDYLTERGYVVAGGDHIGHGKTAATPDELGYLGKPGAISFLIDDLYTMNRLLRERFPGLPIFMLGHSMGSFIARLYAARYPDSLDGIIIHGTAGSNPALGMGKLLVSLITLFKGEKHRSATVKSLAFGSYNKRFPKSEGEDAWLTRDVKMVADRATDPYTSFTFTLSGYRELFSAIGECNSKKHFAEYPKNLKTLIISGDADPVGNYGRGVTEVYDAMVKAGVTAATLKLYPDARHELFNEFGREEIYAYIENWINEAIPE